MGKNQTSTQRTRPIMVRFTESQHDTLKTLALADRRPVSTFCYNLIADYLQSLESAENTPKEITE